MGRHGWSAGTRQPAQGMAARGPRPLARHPAPCPAAPASAHLAQQTHLHRLHHSFAGRQGHELVVDRCRVVGKVQLQTQVAAGLGQGRELGKLRLGGSHQLLVHDLRPGPGGRAAAGRVSRRQCRRRCRHTRKAGWPALQPAEEPCRPTSSLRLASRSAPHPNRPSGSCGRLTTSLRARALPCANFSGPRNTDSSSAFGSAAGATWPGLRRSEGGGMSDARRGGGKRVPRFSPWPLLHWQGPAEERQPARYEYRVIIRLPCPPHLLLLQVQPLKCLGQVLRLLQQGRGQVACVDKRGAAAKRLVRRRGGRLEADAMARCHRKPLRPCCIPPSWVENRTVPTYLHLRLQQSLQGRPLARLDDALQRVVLAALQGGGRGAYEWCRVGRPGGARGLEPLGLV